MSPKIRVGLGQSSHRFLPPGAAKPCVMGGLVFEETPGFVSDSDGDLVFHAICNAITSLTCVPILAGFARDLCQKDGITDSSVYLQKAVEILGRQKVEHLALSLEGKRPRVQERLIAMRQRVAETMRIDILKVGITVISGGGLTDFGCGDGVQCLCVLTTLED